MILLDCELPERNTVKIAEILSANNMSFVPIPDAGIYNCWGFVSFTFGWEKKARWVSEEEMEDHLTNFTEPIDASEATIGDIAVFRRNDGLCLTHTALVTPDRTVVCHKPGGNALCIDTLKNAKLSYGTVSYVRPLTTANNNAKVQA